MMYRLTLLTLTSCCNILLSILRISAFECVHTYKYTKCITVRWKKLVMSAKPIQCSICATQFQPIWVGELIIRAVSASKNHSNVFILIKITILELKVLEMLNFNFHQIRVVPLTPVVFALWWPLVMLLQCTITHELYIWKLRNNNRIYTVVLQ